MTEKQPHPLDDAEERTAEERGTTRRKIMLDGLTVAAGVVFLGSMGAGLVQGADENCGEDKGDGTFESDSECGEEEQQDASCGKGKNQTQVHNDEHCSQAIGEGVVRDKDDSCSKKIESMTHSEDGDCGLFYAGSSGHRHPDQQCGLPDGDGTTHPDDNGGNVGYEDYQGGEFDPVPSGCIPETTPSDHSWVDPSFDIDQNCGKTLSGGTTDTDGCCGKNDDTRGIPSSSDLSCGKLTCVGSDEVIEDGNCGELLFPGIHDKDNSCGHFIPGGTDTDDNVCGQAVLMDNGEEKRMIGATEPPIPDAV